MQPNPRLLSALFIICLLASCTGPSGDSIATPLPTEFLPTAIALTLQAKGVNLVTSTLLPSPTSSKKPSASPTTFEREQTPPIITSTSQTPENIPAIENLQSTKVSQVNPSTLTLTPTLTAKETMEFTPTISNVSATPFEIPLPPPPVETLSPAIPESHIQIFKLGELSMVTSPVQVTFHLTERIVRTVRIELFGEDGRLLTRHLKNFNDVPWSANRFTLNLEFEINAAAELSRLVVSVEDQFGRLTDVNSVNLILLSAGMTEFHPASTLWQRIVIQEPQPKSLVQGGKLIVSGRARPDMDRPLRVMLIAEDGQIIGQRLAGVSSPTEGDYGSFITEVPYTVSDLTFALLVVYEDGKPISDVTHLSSVEIILAP